MVAEVFAGVSALKAAFDMAKGLKDIDDAARRNAAVIELQEKILSAQSAQAELIETVGDLKKRVAEFEAWGAEKQRTSLQRSHPVLSATSRKKECAAPNRRIASVQTAMQPDRRDFSKLCKTDPLFSGSSAMRAERSCISQGEIIRRCAGADRIISDPPSSADRAS
jgi:hypothetical protein